MKLSALAFLLVAVALLSACDNSKAQPEYPVVPAAAVSSEYQNITFTADIEMSDEKYLLSFISPSELKGVTMILNGETVTVVNNGISVDYTDKLINYCPFVRLDEIFGELNFSKPDFTDVGEVLVSVIKVDGTDVKVKLDRNTKEIIEIQTDNSVFVFFNEVVSTPR